MKYSYLLLLSFLILTLSSCQWGMKTETRVYEGRDRAYLEDVAPEITKKLDLENVVIVDTRSYFAYSTSHLPGAISLNWTHFKNKKRPGYLRDDNFRLARSMARKGIGPEKKILVVGEGREGNAEEGQVALAFKELGFEKVEIVKESYVPLPREFKENHKHEAASYWQPKLKRDHIWLRKKVLQELSKTPTERKNLRIIDVRSSKEYVEAQQGSAPLPNINAYNIEWSEFLQDNGRIDPHTRLKLLNLGIGSNDEILVLSNQGKRSAMVVFALHKLGFKSAAHFPGGWQELVR